MSSFLKVLLGFALLTISATVSSAATEETALRVIERHVIDLSAMKERRLIRILVPFSKTIYFIDKGR